MKKIAIIFIVLLLLLGGFFLVRVHSHSDNVSEKMKNRLEVIYSKNKLISFNHFDTSFNDKMTIKVTNKTNETIIYDMKWLNVSNTLKKQNNFLYSINCIGDYCRSLDFSQVPVSDFSIFTNVMIEPDEKQVFNIELKYDGSENNANFKGKLVIDEK